MTKAELVAQMADKAGLNKAQAKVALDAFISSVSTSLRAGKEVRLAVRQEFDSKRMCRARSARQDVCSWWDTDAGRPTLRCHEVQMKLCSDWIAALMLLNAFSSSLRLRFILKGQYTMLRESLCAF